MISRKRLQDADKKGWKRAKAVHFFSDDKEKLREKAAKYFRHITKGCSDPFCCGNPRRKKGTNEPSFQEKKADLDKKEKFDENYTRNTFS